VPFVNDPASTVFQSYGYLFEHACLAFAALAALALELRRRRGAAISRVRGLRPRQVAYGALALLGLSQAMGQLSGSATLQALGTLSAASPLPLVFNSVQGYEFWAQQHQLDLKLTDGELRKVEIDSRTMASLPGPHRMHMLLALPFIVGPLGPQALWQRLLEYELCREGPLARAAGVTAPVAVGSAESLRDGAKTWRGGFSCSR
jgi:hypothetical protein